METKKSKYDTNPLDPDVERNAEESWGNPTKQVGGATRQVGSSAGQSANQDARQNRGSEAPTRRYDNQPLESSYPSVFVPPTYAPPAQQYQQPPPNAYHNPYPSLPTSRPVIGLGIPEKWALLLAYAPWFGIIASLVELFLASKRETRVRFHASQALALHIAFLVISSILKVVAMVSDSGFGSALFGAATTIFLIISMIRVWKGEPHRIAPLEEPAKWFNDHIEPRSQG
ncbi:MAG TPA: DUF4870 domain-containing protein [Pyrinomonadaceae bacterium]|nr:DUF4870 domain-containing protein [Pyrinomonadaceae bacterium]